MRKLLNVFYVTTPDVYLSLDGENVVAMRDREELKRLPLHNLEGIVTFGYTGASPALMGACAERNVSLSFFTASGRFLAEVSGMEKGNVVLRRTQYRMADDLIASSSISKNIITAKLFNSRYVLERATRDHDMRIDVERVKTASRFIADAIGPLRQADNLESIRGIEGEAATRYFSVFNELILQNKEDFFFKTRNRRPPLDNVNSMLSFTYSLLANDIASAIRSVGLDPFVGFLHRDRPGRKSLALDLMEEFRSVIADRFVLSLINKRQIDSKGFQAKENGTILLKDDTRRVIIGAWQNRKQEELTHPFLQEKVEWGLVPYVQALLFARFIRGDLEEYPPFFWK
ncbi:MAG: type I-C CRISPR-associated endonuclease Cas1c [Eubacterium sp.]|jgi:CRISPR-associated protein Cas1|nr:type I-C CRISPR-associated endonuclease Cas1c [Eubacterium sp.]